MSAVEAKEEMTEQEMKNSGIDNEEVLLSEPVVVHHNPNDDEGASDNDNDDSNPGSKDTVLAVGILPEDVIEVESQPDNEPQVVWVLKIFPLLTIFRKVSLEGYKYFVLADSKTSYILNLVPDGWSARQKGCGINETSEAREELEKILLSIKYLLNSFYGVVEKTKI
eukprot:3030516-Ditylum_brightwellii.AAC.1